jgi:hypothetical protein
MSKSNGEKARSAIEKRRRTAQRVKDRAKRAALGGKSPESSGASRAAAGKKP